MRHLCLITPTEVVQFGTLISKPYDDLTNGDIILWRSDIDGHFEIHTVHSFSVYGVKTYTGYNESDGSSVVVNLGGIVGVFKLQ